MRAPFQILVIPFRRAVEDVEYAVLQRSGAGWWQFVAGGGEDDESPRDAALRETWEETGLVAEGELIVLDHEARISREAFSAAALWGPDVYVIPEHYFAVDVGDRQLRLSSEHAAVRWLSYDDAHGLLRWDSNRTGMWELSERLKRAKEDPSVLRRI